VKKNYENKKFPFQITYDLADLLEKTNLFWVMDLCEFSSPKTPHCLKKIVFPEISWFSQIARIVLLFQK